MPKDEPDPEDPMALVGVVCPATGDAEIVEMADSFVEEFARLGWSAEKVFKMFTTPFYAAAHRIYRLKGEAFIRDRITAAAPYFEAHDAPAEASHATGV